MSSVTPKLRVALVGLGFGAEFVPIYQDHPDVASVVCCDPRPKYLNKVCDQFGIKDRFTSLDDILAMKDIDAVHLVRPIPLHAEQTVAVLRSGKHCACTVPMATSFEDIQAIIQAEEETGKNYMMMETAVYTREFLLVKEAYDRGDFGTIAFARGSHIQDMEGWPEYWNGLPPHHYMTHAIAPILHLLDSPVQKVHCLGSGTLPKERQEQYGNPFPAETAIFRLSNSDVAVEVTRTLFQTARMYSEAFSVYGDKKSFEWQQIDSEEPYMYTMKPSASGRGSDVSYARVEPVDRQDLLPPSIAPYTKSHVHEGGEHLSFVQGGGHSGSHPHLVHEFVRSIVEQRRPMSHGAIAARWTAPGIAAHMSAMKGGDGVDVPTYD